MPIKNSIIGLGFYFDQNQNKIDSGAIIKIEWLSKRNGSSSIDAFQNYYFASKKLNTIQNKFSGIVFSPLKGIWKLKIIDLNF